MLASDPAISVLGINLAKTIIQKDTCTSMFTAALFIIAKTWKQPKWNTTQPLKKELNNATCSNMDGPRDYHTK